MCFSRCARETAKKKQAQKRLPYSQLFPAGKFLDVPRHSQVSQSSG